MTVTRALILVLLTTSLAAKEAIITNGGRRLIDLDPADATTNCAGWSYDAMPLRDDAGNISTVYSAGDALTNHCSSDMTSDDRFGDRIWRHVKGADGTWDGIPVLARENLGWMSDAAYVTSHPEAFVAHIASPATTWLSRPASTIRISAPASMMRKMHAAPAPIPGRTSP
jgi:hypothetical protein